MNSSDDGKQQQQQQQPLSGRKKRQCDDAFSVLMSATKQRSSKRRLSSVRFVLCPAGCGIHVSETNIHHHLDQCISRNDDGSGDNSNKASQKKKKSPKQPPDKKKKAQCMMNEAMGNASTDVISTQQLEQVQVQEERQRSTLPEDKTQERQWQQPPSGSDSDSSCFRVISSENRSEHSSGNSTSIALSLCEDRSMIQDTMTQNDNEISKQNNETTSAHTLPMADRTQPSSPRRHAEEDHPNANQAAKEKTKNAFQHMMMNSRKQISQQHTNNVVIPSLYFCLWGIPQADTTTKCTVSLETSLLSHPGSTRISWQGTVRVSERSQEPTQHYQICLCSTVPSAMASDGAVAAGINNNNYYYSNRQQTQSTSTSTRRRWVQRHSRLSVPVLKSMLQKSIRRRRPLPSVRIAMELADKALGELLRRLPIIILEDSTLHHQLPFLVWLMMAQSSRPSESSSSSYDVPDVLLKRVFGIIFEVASCRLRDSIPPTLSSSSSLHENDISLGFLLQSAIVGQQQGSEKRFGWNGLDTALIPCSILFRSCYGGMKGDVAMLQQYATLWYQRFSQPTSASSKLVYPLPATIVKSSSSSTSVTSWLQVPMVLHDESAKAKNAGLLSSLLEKRLPYLSLDDVCREGVDFHCSNVMDHILHDSLLVGVASDILILLSQNYNQGDVTATSTGDKDVDDFARLQPEERQAWLERTWKSAMWHKISGVNHRLPLVEYHNDDDNQEPNPRQSSNLESGGNTNNNSKMLASTKIWNELVAPKVAEYQRQYIVERLANPH